jgi:hypothetical protein
MGNLFSSNVTKSDEEIGAAHSASDVAHSASVAGALHGGYVASIVQRVMGGQSDAHGSVNEVAEEKGGSE